jgi:hypothetical protein
MTTTTDSTKTVNMGGVSYLNHTNLTYLFDADSDGTTGKSPTLKFTLEDVPTGTGTATVTASILDHNGVDGTESARAAGESAISITVKVNYSGNGTTATLTVPVQDDASGSYIKADGTEGTFTLANVDTDSFGITQANAVTGAPASLDVKMSALYDAFIAGAGTSDMLKIGSYAVKLETTLPLADAPDSSTDTAATVTTFQGIVELVAETPISSVTGTSGADALASGNNGMLINGSGGADTIALGTGKDYVILAKTDGSETKAGAATVTDFKTSGADKFLLEGLTSADISVEAGTTSSDSLISVKAASSTSGNVEYLMHVTGIAVASLDVLSADFITDFA